MSQLDLQNQVDALRDCLVKAEDGQKAAEDRLASVTRKMEVWLICFLMRNVSAILPCLLPLCAAAVAYVSSDHPSQWNGCLGPPLGDTAVGDTVGGL